jgi:hypothetical protein
MYDGADISVIVTRFWGSCATDLIWIISNLASHFQQHMHSYLDFGH